MLVKTAKRSYGKMSNDMAVLLMVLPVGYGSPAAALSFLASGALCVVTLPTTSSVRACCLLPTCCVKVNLIE